MNTATQQPVTSMPKAEVRSPIHRFYITFGQRSPFRHGYVEIVVNGASSDGEAMKRAHDAAMDGIGDRWSNIYKHDDFISRTKETADGTGKSAEELFPEGKIGQTIHA